MPTPRGNSPGRRPDIEADLKDKYHVDYLYLSNIDTDQFDHERSQANQARFTALDESTVELYKDAVERGDAFPAVLAYRPSRAAGAKLVIIDGNHRLAAHHQAGKVINVYEIDGKTKPAAITYMTFAFNTKHGRPTSEEERVSHALYLIDGGATHEAASSAMGVPMRILRRAIARAQGDKRAAEVGVDPREWSALSVVIRTRLLNISTDEGFRDAAHVAYIANLGSEEVFEMVALLNNSRSGIKQRAIVRAETERLQERIQTGNGGLGTGGSRRSTGMHPRARVGMVLSQILALPDDLDGVASTYGEPEKLIAADRAEDAAQKLHKLARILNPALK